MLSTILYSANMSFKNEGKIEFMTSSFPLKEILKKVLHMKGIYYNIRYQSGSMKGTGNSS